MLLGLSHANATVLKNHSSSKVDPSFPTVLLNSSLTSAKATSTVDLLDNGVLSGKKNSLYVEETHKMNSNNASPVAPIPSFAWLIASAALGLFGMKLMKGTPQESESI